MISIQKTQKKNQFRKDFFVFYCKMSFLASGGRKMAIETIFKSKQKIFGSSEEGFSRFVVSRGQKSPPLRKHKKTRFWKEYFCILCQKVIFGLWWPENGKKNDFRVHLLNKLAPWWPNKKMKNAVPSGIPQATIMPIFVEKFENLRPILYVQVAELR